MHASMRSNQNKRPFAVVAIGASEGGLAAFKTVIGSLPADLNMAFLLMQHLDPSYQTMLYQILQRETKLPVTDFEEEMELKPNHVYTIPSNKLLVVNDRQLKLKNRPEAKHPKYSIDTFFSVVAEVYHSHAIGILLSDTGNDGTAGLKKIKKFGGISIVQCPESANYSAMPENAIAAGAADFSLKPSKISEQLVLISIALNNSDSLEDAGTVNTESINDTIETSTEQLHSTNEEMITVKQELFEGYEPYKEACLYAEAIVDTIPEPLLVLNFDFWVKSANRFFCEAFRVKENDITGKNFLDFQEGRWSTPELRKILLQIKNGEVKEAKWEVTFPIRADLVRVILLRARIINPSNYEKINNEELILLSFEDITLRKKEESRLKEAERSVKKQLRTMQTFFANAPALFCILKGPDHIFEYANPRYFEVTGATDLIGKSFAHSFPEFENAGYISILNNVYETEAPIYEKEMKAPNFQNLKLMKTAYVDINCQAYCNEEDEVEGVFLFCYEVTELVKARTSVEKNADELEELVHKRTAMLQDANKALEQSNKNLQEFASIASHDLQEPLRKIKTFTNILRNKFDHELSKDAIDLISKTEAAALRMSTLIKDVLNYSKISRVGHSLSVTDLDHILKNVLGDFSLMIEEKKAIIHQFDTLPVIKAIPTQINQLFYNIISNSLKFSSKIRVPLIEIRCRKLTKDEQRNHIELDDNLSYFQLSFKDNGIGFDQQFSDQIFDIFERLNNTTEYKGTGIGLALTRKILNGHQGIIWGEGTENEGSIFHVILPEH